MSLSLYEVFQEHLKNQSADGEVSTSDFVENVVVDYLERMVKSGHIVPASIREEIETELIDEVLEMTRKTTYGHFSLSAYLKNKNLKSG